MGVYIQSKQKVGNQIKYIMADTDRPNFKKIGTKQEILNAERKYHFNIDGVDLKSNDICVVVPIKDTIDMIKYGDRKQPCQRIWKQYHYVLNQNQLVAK